MGREPRFPDLRDGLGDLARASVVACPAASEITIRLYGGWNGNVPATRLHLRGLTEAAIGEIAGRSGRTRIRIELAEAPIWNRSIRLLRTVRSAPISQFRATLATPDACIQRDTCSVADLRDWCSGRCPRSGCPARLADAAMSYGQKMVDTLLTADAIVLSRDELSDALQVASDDEDLIPALLAVAGSKLKVYHLARRSVPDYYAGILERFGVTIHTW